jgi:hypothetical protein
MACEVLVPVAQNRVLMVQIAPKPPIAVVNSCCNAHGAHPGVYPVLTMVRKDARFVGPGDPAGAIPMEKAAWR